METQALSHNHKDKDTTGGQDQPGSEVWRHETDADKPLNEADADKKIRDNRADYNNRPSNSISFMPAVASTSGRLLCELVHIFVFADSSGNGRQHHRQGHSPAYQP